MSECRYCKSKKVIKSPVSVFSFSIPFTSYFVEIINNNVPMDLCEDCCGYDPAVEAYGEASYRTGQQDIVY